MNLEDRIRGWTSSIADDATRLIRCTLHGDLGATVTACPDWDLRALLLHTGTIHRWATEAIRTSARPSQTEVERPGADASGAEIAGWLETGVEALLDALAAADPLGPTWHPFPFDQVNWFWARRQAQETSIHRWDAEMTTDGSSSIDPASAADGIDEYFEAGLPRILQREAVPPPAMSLHVHCTDQDLDPGMGEWTAWSDEDGYHMEATHRKGDAALRGSAEHLLLVLMGRADIERVDVVGDPAAASAWLGLPGL